MSSFGDEVNSSSVDGNQSSTSNPSTSGGVSPNISGDNVYRVAPNTPQMKRLRIKKKNSKLSVIDETVINQSEKYEDSQEESTETTLDSATTTTTSSNTVDASTTTKSNINQNNADNEQPSSLSSQLQETPIKKRGMKSSNDSESVYIPYTTRVLYKLLSFFGGLINPNDVRKTLPVRTLGLNIINSIIESQGPTIACLPELMGFVCNDMFKYLMQALQKIKKEDTSALNMIIRICFNLFVSLSSRLKFQIEVFFIFALKFLSDEKTTVEQIEILLEMITQLMREPSFAVDLYINFDCNLYRDNLFSNLVDFLYRASTTEDRSDSSGQSSSGSSSTSSSSSSRNSSSEYIRILAFDALTAILHSVHKKSNPQSIQSNDEYLNNPFFEEYSPSMLLEKKQKKSIWIQAAQLFKTQPKNCFDYLQDKKLLAQSDPKAVANFLRKCTFLDKPMIGEYIGTNKDFNKQVLQEYVYTFDFRGVPFIKALRQFLESFIPGGESQVIERCLECFVAYYLESNDNTLIEGIVLTSSDPAFLLAYSIVLLNVDWHSPVLAERPKMNLQTYTRQLKGLNSENDFPQDFVERIYDEIVKDEIKVHREHLVKNELTHSTWFHLYEEACRENEVEFIESREYAPLYCPQIFNNFWRQIIEAAKQACNGAKSDDVQKKALSVLFLCASTSSEFKLVNVLDKIINTLCELSGILQQPQDRFAINFGKEEKFQISTQSLFEMVETYSNDMRESWANVTRCLLRLQLSGVLPKIVSFKDFFTNPEDLEDESSNTPEMTSFADFALGFVSGKSWMREDKDESPTEKKYKQLSIQIIKKCNILKIIGSTGSLDPQSLLMLVKSITAESRQLISATLNNGNSPQNLKASNSSTSDSRSSKSSSTSDATVGAIFSTDMLTQITLNNSTRIPHIWLVIKDYFEFLVTTPSMVDFQFLYRAITDLMVISHTVLCCSESQDIRESSLQLLLKTTKRSFNSSSGGSSSGSSSSNSSGNSINASQSQKIHKKIAIGLSRVLMLSIEHFKSHLEWELATDLIRWVLNDSNSTTSKDGFEVLYYVITSHSLSDSAQKLGGVTYVCKENFSLLLDLISVSIINKNSNNEAFLSIKSLELLQHLVSIVPSICSFENGDDQKDSEAVVLYLIPTFQFFSLLCRESARIETQVLTALQQSLMLPQLSNISPSSWAKIIEKVVFPLLTEYLRATQLDDTLPKEKIEDMRIRIINLLSKTFLQHLSKFTSYDDFGSLWMKILKHFETYKTSGKSALLIGTCFAGSILGIVLRHCLVLMNTITVLTDLFQSETISESLKNILMVLHTSGGQKIG
eukprot:TRINITY_DN6081_c1_g1_i2.p1 TRINITY_DN6081_c1_g1~~TRINITY_DN6081_c1_g1_i2.p1  ORF type:complete len:1352 (+),score=332.94 TRINITY_DN6081_c1_g1_i2:101-4057(+)